MIDTIILLASIAVFVGYFIYRRVKYIRTTNRFAEQCGTTGANFRRVIKRLEREGWK